MLMRCASRFCNLAARLARDEDGQDILEYALLGAFVCLIAIMGAGLLGEALNSWYTNVGAEIDAAAPSN